jgi:hypothetical protein
MGYRQSGELGVGLSRLGHEHRSPIDRDMLLRDLGWIGLTYAPFLGASKNAPGMDTVKTFKDFQNYGTNLLERGDWGKAFIALRYQKTVHDLWENPISALGQNPAPDMPLVFRKGQRPSSADGRSKELYNQHNVGYENNLDELIVGSLGLYLALIDQRVQAEGDIESGARTVVQFTNYNKGFAIPMLRSWCTAVVPQVPASIRAKP